jgi:hypothetical protein
MKKNPKDVKHFGVLGMKWGHRRGNSSNSSSKKLANKYGTETLKSVSSNIIKDGAKVAKGVLKLYVGYKVGMFVARLMAYHLSGGTYKDWEYN